MMTLSSAQCVRFEFHMWKRIDADILLAEYENNSSLEFVLPKSPAVYMWKRNPTFGLNPHNQVALKMSIEKMLTEVFAATESISVTYNVSINGMLLKSPGLPEAKKEALSSILVTADGRKAVLSYLDSIRDHLPSLYVGEAENLAKRIREHLLNSDFKTRLKKRSSLEIQQLSLYYKDSSSDKVERELEESITTMLTGGWLVARQG